MFAELNISSPAEEYDEQDERMSVMSKIPLISAQLETQIRQCSCAELMRACHRNNVRCDHARWSTEPPVQLPNEVLTVGTVMQSRSSARKNEQTSESTPTITGDRL